VGGVDLRIFTEPQQGASYDDLLRVAKTTEDAGFDAFFRSDHFMRIPMGAPGSPLPGPTDAWVTLGALARETSRIRLGTLVTSATFRHPSQVAISVAQVDQMSGGRVEFGLGSGWYDAEHRAYGFPLPELGERFDRYAEQLETITGLWGTPEGETFSFQGKHYQLEEAPGLPKPAQRKGPPVIIGGGGKKRTPALAARYASEFNLPFTDTATTAAQFDRVRAATRDAGRDPGEMVFSVAQVVAVGRDEAEFARRAEAIGQDPAQLRRNGITGTVSEAVDTIGRWREETGISRLYLQVLDLSDLDHLELVASEIAPQLR
jgi:F420-dependent oxidoreductase-like protein